MYTTTQLAEAANLAPQTILNYVKEGVIEPEQVTPDGRYYFDEDLVICLILRKSSSLLRSSILFVAFDNSPVELQALEQRYASVIQRENYTRVDDILDYMKNMKKLLQEDVTEQKSCILSCLDETMKEYGREMEKMENKLICELLVDKKISHLESVLPFKDTMFDGTRGILEKAQEEDRQIINGYLISYNLRRDKLQRKYCIPDIQKIITAVKNKETNPVYWAPKTGTVKGIFKRAEQTYYRKAVDIQIQEKLSKGYCSLLKILSGDEDSVYHLLKKANSSEYKYIEVCGFEKATPEEQQVIRFFEEIKQVIIHEPEMEESV